MAFNPFSAAYSSGSLRPRSSAWSDTVSGRQPAPVTSEWATLPPKAREDPPPDRPLLRADEENLRQIGIVFESRLGRGSYGEVWLTKVSNPRSDTYLACKITRLRRFENELPLRDAVIQMTRESDVLNEVQHEHVVRFDHIIKLHDKSTNFAHPITVLTFLERCHYTLKGLHNWLAQPMPEALAIDWFIQIAHALQYIHECGIAHLDIKPGNILIKEETGNQNSITTKLSDFGLAEYFDAGSDSRTRIKGTKHFMAPEMEAMVEDTDAAPCDVYSLAVTLADVIVNVCPHGTDPPYCVRVIQNVQNKVGMTRISRELQDLLYKMTRTDPEERITISEVISHQWTSQVEYVPGGYFTIQ